MKDLLKKDIEIPILKRAESAIKKFTIGEKAIFYIIGAIFIFSTLSLLSSVNDHFSVTIPAKGGSLSEGIIGSPRFINPILATSDVDRDLSTLVFSGLLRSSTEGTLIPDLAESYTISGDGLTYTITMKNKIFFHDEEPITADDVIFTVSKAQDPAVKSPRRAEWEGVTVEKISDNVIAFHLPRPYYPFIENLTLGIIPKHLWKDAGPEEFAFSLRNITPIGSGPFKIESMDKNTKGIPVIYKMSSFSKYVDQSPYLKTLYVKLYASESELISAWKKGEISSMGGISPNSTNDLIKAGAKINHLNLPRIYGIFFNQNQYPIFTSKSVRTALSMVIDKNLIIEEVLSGYGSTLNGPLPYIKDKEEIPFITESSTSSPSNLEQARKILEKDGWILNKETGIYEKTEKTTTKAGKKQTTLKTLSFSLDAPNVPELKNVANMVTKAWKELGVSVDIKLFELSDLSQNVIRPRKYDALLFGQVIGRNGDLFAFWHSSQRNDPGYNIALYTNSKVDKLLNDVRGVRNQKDQEKITKNIYDEINNDIPAIFLYTPDYLYILPKNIKGFEAGSIASPSERFADITNWFSESDRVWEILAPTQKN